MHNRVLLHLAKMSDSGSEMKYISEAFASNWVAPLGPNVDGFEKDLEQFLNREMSPLHSTAFRSGRHDVLEIAALSSCTAAIHLALLMLGVKQDDEVLCQSFSFCASSNPVTYCGAKPVFVDSDKATWNIDPNLLEEAIKDRISKTGRKPKAIIAVDLYGMPADWDALEEISRHYEIPVIEDAANALGSRYGGRPCGTFGDIATLSFNGNKIITTSGGGAIVCHDADTKRRAIHLATQAREPFLYYQHEEIGYNYRMSNISAGIGRGQMTVLDDYIRHHKHIHELYTKLFRDIDGIEVHDNPSDRYDSNFWLTTIVLNPAVIRQDVLSLCTALSADNIESRPLWKPMHMQPVFQSAPAYTNGVSEHLFKHGICLPSGPCVSDEDVNYIFNCMKKAIRC